jgi:clan AA aspartic protease (TIGR02281 family)
MFLLALGTLFFGGLTVASSRRIESDGGAPIGPSQAYAQPPQYGGAAYGQPQPGYGGYQMQYAAYGNEVRIPCDAKGHHHVRANIAGRTVSMMVDTGSTGVVIDHATAWALGIPLDRVRYDFPVRVGDTVYYAYRFAIPEIIVEGRLSARDVDAVVHREDGGPNLLGMSFLNRFRVQMAGGEMVIGG